MYNLFYDFLFDNTDELSDNGEELEIEPELNNQDQENMSNKLNGIKFGFIKRESTVPRLSYENLQSKYNLDSDYIQIKNTSVDLKDQFDEVYDQGSLGSCTAQAIASLYDYHYNSSGGSGSSNLQGDFKASRLFIYYNERYLENHVYVDSGATIEDGMNVLRIYGACSEELCEYNIRKFTQVPSENAYKNALSHKIYTSSSIENSIDLFKLALSHGNPVVFGFDVYESFMTLSTAKSGIMPIPKDTEKLLGGHAVVAVGYNDEKDSLENSKGCFLVRNSWGKDWGNDGYFWMPYENIKYISDCWIIE